MADNLASMLCYILGFITGIIFLVLEPYNKNRAIRFHAFQSIFLSVGLFAIRLVLLTVLPFGFYGFGIWAMLWTIFNLACFVLYLYMLIMAYQGKTIVLPVIGPLAQKQAQG